MKLVSILGVLAVLFSGCAGRTPAPGLGLTNDVINQTILKHRAEIRACYDQLQKSRPGQKGKLVIAFRVEPTGAVGALSVREDAIGDPAFLGCILDRMTVMPFPTAAVFTDVPAYPFYFNTPTR